MARDKVALAGSDRGEPAAAVAAGDVDPAAPITVTLHLKHPAVAPREPGSAADLAALARRTTRQGLAGERRRDYADAKGAIAAFAADAGLAVADVDLARRRIRLRGPTAAIAKAFDAPLRLYETGNRRFRARTGPLLVPREIAPWLRAVTGLDARPQVERRTVGETGAAAGVWPSTMAQLYGIQAEGAAGQCVGIIELGGGYAETDLRQAMNAMGVPFPKLAEVSVGAVNTFGGGSASDREVALDLQVVAGAAPGADIAVYFAEFSPDGFVNAVLEAVHDDKRKPAIVVISWGGAENIWTPSFIDAMNAALRDAVRLGVTVVAAAGDGLACDGQFGRAAHVDFPASSPYVTGCGGTSITLSPDGKSIVAEQAWNDGASGTGGGISNLFAVPDYQKNIALPASANGDGRVGRGVPDVAAAAAPVNGYRIVVDGKDVVQPGTSAVAPLWAALVALANARRGVPLGFLNPFLYGNASLCRGIVRGNNRIRGIGYDAGPGWNACTGLGVPDGAAILAALTAMV